VRLASPNQLIIKTRTVTTTPGSNACADDLVADTSTVRVPAGLETTHPVIVKIDATTLTLAPR
jgi:hypothetical protein